MELLAMAIALVAAIDDDNDDDDDDSKLERVSV